MNKTAALSWFRFIHLAIQVNCSLSNVLVSVDIVMKQVWWGKGGDIKLGILEPSLYRNQLCYSKFSSKRGHIEGFSVIVSCYKQEELVQANRQD